ncbi:hypothetical protein [Streptomyces umbrinus]|uniref:hypothetical protein n=1 Tax=Streptomyces umbrinus TaxID=67370 RepID=UPI0033ECEDA9
MVQKHVCVVGRAFDVLWTDFAATPDRMELGREPVASGGRTSWSTSRAPSAELS